MNIYMYIFICIYVDTEENRYICMLQIILTHTYTYIEIYANT